MQNEKKLSVKEIILYVVEIIIMLFDAVMSLGGFISESSTAGLLFLVSAFLISPFFEKILRKCLPLQNSMVARISIQFSSSFIAFLIGAIQLPQSEPVAETSVSVAEVEQTVDEEANTEMDEIIVTKETTTEIQTKLETTIAETTITTIKTTTVTVPTTIVIQTELESTIADTQETTEIESETEANITESETTDDTTEKITETAPSANHYIRNENLKGHGWADSGRSEPNYVNVIGYVVISSTKGRELKETDNFTDTSLWTVPTFEPDKQFWNQTGSLPHKTEVVVLEQNLEHSKYGAYHGYLLVEKLDDGTQYYINVDNYITKPYWNYSNDLKEAALTGDFVAEYNQVSDYYPVTNSGGKVTLDDGMKVLVTGISGSSKGVNREETEITATVWKEWKYGYGGVEIHFNTKDLTIIY